MLQALQIRADGPPPHFPHIGTTALQNVPQPVHRIAPKCSRCGLRPLCLASGLKEEDLPRLESVVGHWRMVRRGEYIFRVGDPFHSLYTLRSGSFKTVAGHEQGIEHVSGYILPGEILGLGAIGGDQYDCDAIALEDSAVCVISFASLETLCQDLRAAQRNLMRLLSQEIVRESRQMVLLSGMTSERRVAAFLLNVSDRLCARGYAARAFTLRMTREEIGSFLGIKLETVSRTFSRFQREGLIRVDGKQIELFDMQALAEI